MSRNFKEKLYVHILTLLTRLNLINDSIFIMLIRRTSWDREYVRFIMCASAGADGFSNSIYSQTRARRM